MLPMDVHNIIHDDERKDIEKGHLLLFGGELGPNYLRLYYVSLPVSDVRLASFHH